MKKYLHLSFNSEYHSELIYIADRLDIQIKFLEFKDGTLGKYNISRERAQKYWDKHYEYFNLFDGIIITDTAPICRVFLQNKWSKLLIIWIHNRFDYHDAASLDCVFPDQEYYDLMQSTQKQKNIKIYGNTFFEMYYAKHIKNIDLGNEVIEQIGLKDYYYQLNSDKNLEKTFWVPPHNNTTIMNLVETLHRHDIKTFHENIKFDTDIRACQGIIYIPESWTHNLFYTYSQLLIPIWIPSLDFYKTLKKDYTFYWSPPYIEEKIDLSIWYHPKYKDIICYFNSWEDLILKIKGLNLVTHKEKLKNFFKKHNLEILSQWKSLLN